MSLVGSLEDLGLGDILQIVSLSRKSGMLMLRSDGGHGRIVLRDGLVQGAAIKGEAENLRSLLVAAGCVDEQSFGRAEAVALGESLSLDVALGRECGLPPERLQALRREHVERSVMRMFGWRTGEFSFEIREELSDEDRELLLPSGLNTQYLAMEATRLRDEHVRDPENPEALEAQLLDVTESDALDPVFSGEDGDAVDSLALLSARRADNAEVAVRAARTVETQIPVSVAAAADPPGPRRTRYLVAVDPNLSSLEWLKASVDGLFRRVHIFQRHEDAVHRIRQYLVRGVEPIVVVADPHPAGKPAADPFAARLRGIAPTLPILALRPENAPRDTPTGIDGVVVRPASPSADRDRWHLYEAVAERLRADLEPWLRGERSVAARRRARSALGRLKGVSERLRDPSTQGEVLSLVLEFAAETFARVAMFMLRDDVAIGIAQRGLPATGGPDDAAMRSIELGPDQMPELFERVLEQRTALRSTLAGPRERNLALRLGAGAPSESYAAPIESGGCVVALVYADNLPQDRPIRDTTALEIVLHEAGLVLDRALLERALAARK